MRVPRADRVSRAARRYTHRDLVWPPEQAIVSGWPADVGPFAGLSLAWAGRDSLSGSILLDSKLGVQARPE